MTSGQQRDGRVCSDQCWTGFGLHASFYLSVGGLLIKWLPGKHGDTSTEHAAVKVGGAFMGLFFFLMDSAAPVLLLSRPAFSGSETVSVTKS